MFPFDDVIMEGIYGCPMDTSDNKLQSSSLAPYIHACVSHSMITYAKQDTVYIMTYKDILQCFIRADAIIFMGYSNRNIQLFEAITQFINIIDDTSDSAEPDRWYWFHTAIAAHTRWRLIDSAQSLLWRHKERDGVSNHQLHHCLLNFLFGRRSKITSKLHINGHHASNARCYHVPTSIINDGIKQIAVVWMSKFIT